jgi:hypothetical protein
MKPMNSYPEAVTQIADDYLVRVKYKLQGVPTREQDEFVREIQSHVYEAYQQTAGEDEVARILAVLRNLGEPAEVVSDRLPGTMVRAGSRRSLPLYILGGIVIALFGLPIGFSGLGVLIGLLSGLGALIVAYYAVAGVSLMAGGLFMLLGFARLCAPSMWDRLVALGYINMGQTDDFFNQLPASVQGIAFILGASLFIALAVAMLWLGKHMLRGLRFLAVLVFDWIRQFARTIRAKISERNRNSFVMRETVPASK